MEFGRLSRMLTFTAMIITISHFHGASAALSTCTGTLEGPTGTFTSPNYPHSPGSRRQPEAAAVGSLLPDEDDTRIICEWRIIVPKGRGIQLNFGDFDMAAGLDECDKGELEVFSGIDDNKRSLDKYCGSDEVGTVQVKTNSATVVFRRPVEFSGKGFLVSYIDTTPGETRDDFVTCFDKGSNHVGVSSYSVLCPGGCANITDMVVRGENAYRDDSYLCKAAVHAGVISDVFGGRVSVQKQPGNILYMGSEANGVISEAGAMSDAKFEFVVADRSCEEQIVFRDKQLTASSFWTNDPKDPTKTKWKPDKAILNKQLEAWSPNNPITEQWLQVDLMKTMMITAISTRGSSEKFYTTTSYKIAYRNDTNSNWTFYSEDGVDHDKVFDGNGNIFKTARNNFIRPRIVGRFIRVYPTPVDSEGKRYALQIALYGCAIEELTAAEVINDPENKKPTTTALPEKMTTTTVPDFRTTSSAGPVKGKRENVTTATTKSNSKLREEATGPGGVTIVKSPEAPNPGDPTMNESSIIVIAIVAALAVTSILLAALVLILVRKRKKDPKDGPISSHPLQPIPDNNNTRFYYKNKKSRKRGRKNKGEYFQNADYKDTLLQVSLPQNAMGLAGGSQNVTLPAEQQHFHPNATQQQNGTMPPFLPNGVMRQHNSFHPADETDSFVTDDDDDHEYHEIDEDRLVRQTPVPSTGRGSSKASTGSSLGNHSRKSDTMQRAWGVDGNQWNNGPQMVQLPPNSPVFPFPERPINGAIQATPHMASFTSNPPINNGGFFHHNSQLNRNHTFSGGEAPNQHPNLRRGNSQSPSRLQRHSSSSNNSSSSHPPYSHDPNNPYYSSVPNGDGNPVALNHMMYGGPTIPEQSEVPASASKRVPSYKVPRSFGGDLPALPDKIGKVQHMQNGNDISSGGPGRTTPPSTMRSDYDRLYRNNSSGPTDNNFSVFNGSHSQYNQLNLNTADV